MNNLVVTDGIDKAEVLNSYFQSVFTYELDTELPDKGPSPYPSMSNIDITTQGIAKLLNGLNIHKASGSDLISTRFLKETADVIAPLLQVIFKASLNTGEVPSDWRIANISPIFKKGDHCLPQKYWPISLTSTVSKILEHIISSHIMEHLERNHILYELQYGFRRNRSCESQLISLINDLTKSYDAGQQSDVICMDIAKAFDTVPHNRLKLKLQWYGITGITLQWISSFLAMRHQRVVINNTFSSLTAVTSGIPQGMVLGPTLFLIYINDILLIIFTIVI